MGCFDKAKRAFDILQAQFAVGFQRQRLWIFVQKDVAGEGRRAGLGVRHGEKLR